MTPAFHTESGSFRIGIIDTGVNPWHSHVRGVVSGMRIFLDDAGKIREDEDFRDLVGHGTAVAGILRQGLPEAEFFVVRVFDETLDSYPSLVARALLRAAAEGCRIINLSLGMPPGPGAEVLVAACQAVQKAGSVLVAAGHPGRPGLLPASLPGVTGVVADDHLKPGEVTVNPGQPYSHAASGWPRDLKGLPSGANLWGNSFACSRVTLGFALEMGAGLSAKPSLELQRSNPSKSLLGDYLINSLLEITMKGRNMKKLLRINMASQTTCSEVVDGSLQLSGGRSLIARILHEEVDAKSDPLGPENKLIVCPGLLADTVAPCSGRISVGGKSPLTKTIKEANAGGTMAKRMAALDLHGLVLEGQPQPNDWFVLVIDASGVGFLPAQPYLGMNNYQLGEELRKALGSDISIASIGLAGERGYLNSSIQFTDLEGHPSRAAARGGLGALMGSKGVKAIVFKDVKKTDWQYEDRAKFVSANKAFSKSILAHPFSGQGLPALGTALLVNVTNEMGILPTHNFSKGRWEHAEQVSGERIAELQAERGGKMSHICHRGCVIRCSQIYNDKDGNYLTSGFEYETIGLFGPNCGISDIDVIARLDKLCDDLGVDTMDAGCAIGMCMEAGLIEFGDAEGALRLAQEMVAGTELGRVLGNGTEATGRHLGVKRIPTVKGQAMAAYDPRGLKGLGVTYATSPMGADHTAGNSIGDHSLDGTCKDGQVDLSRNLQIVMTVFDSLGLCIFSGICCEDPEALGHLVDMMSAKFGGEWTVDRLMGLGVQTLILEKQFNQGAGFSAKDDRLPDFMYTESLESVAASFDISDEELAKALYFGEPV